MPKLPRFIKIGALLLIAGVIIEAWVVNSLSSYGDKLSDLEREKAKLELENQVLKNELASQAALKLVEQRAKSVGFEPIRTLEYINE